MYKQNASLLNQRHPSIKTQTKIKPSGVAAKKPTPPAPKAQGAGTSTTKSNVRAQRTPIKAERKPLRGDRKTKKGKSTTVGTPSKLKQPTPAQLRAFRSGDITKAALLAAGVSVAGIGMATKSDKKTQSASTAAAATTKKRPVRPKPDQSIRRKSPGGRTAAQAAAEEAAARKRIRDAAKKEERC